MSFGTNLQYIRAAKQLTQEQLAEKLGVSRQSVSKWESDAMMPELDKLLALCELAGCTLDSLLRGDLAAQAAEDTAGYDAHFNLFARQLAAGVQLAIFSMAAGNFCNFLRLSLRTGGEPAGIAGSAVQTVVTTAAFPAGVSGIVTALLLIPAVSLLALAGLEHQRFVQKHPVLRPFYSDSELDAHAQWFTRRVVCAIALALLSLVARMAGPVLADTLFLSAEACGSLFRAVSLVLLSVAGRMLVCAGVQHSKYDIDAYNRENDPSPEAREAKARAGRLSGCVMLAAVAVFLVWGFLFDDWRHSWIALIAGALLCVGVSVALSREERQ